MPRLSHRALTRSLGVLLDIHRATDIVASRETIAVALRRLIPCERVSVDAVNLDERNQFVVPTPIPAYWGKLGEVWLAHHHDHPIWRNNRGPDLAPAVVFSDHARDSRWRKSALRHEYYQMIGVRDQMALFIFKHQRSYVGVACSRASRDFCSEDRALFDLLGPHLAGAWRNARLLSCPPAPVARANAAPAPVHWLKVDLADHTIGQLNVESSDILQRFFPGHRGSRTLLPEDLQRWLRAQRARFGSSDGLAALPATFP